MCMIYTWVVSLLWGSVKNYGSRQYEPDFKFDPEFLKYFRVLATGVKLVRIDVHRALVCIIYLPMSTDPDSENWSDLEIGDMVMMTMLVQTLKKKPNSNLKLNSVLVDLTMKIGLVVLSAGQSERQDLDWAYMLASLSMDYTRTMLNLPLAVVMHQFACAILLADLKTIPKNNRLYYRYMSVKNILPGKKLVVVFQWEITEIEINLVRQSDSSSIKKFKVDN